MNTEYTLQATKRENKGTSNSKKIRKNNGIPAVVYGDKNEVLERLSGKSEKTEQAKPQMAVAAS